MKTDTPTIDRVNACFRACVGVNDPKPGELARLRKATYDVDHWGLDLIKGLGSFARETLRRGGPTRTTLQGVLPDGDRFPALWIWATVDSTAPEARIEQLCEEVAALRSQRDELVTALESISDYQKENGFPMRVGEFKAWELMLRTARAALNRARGEG